MSAQVLVADARAAMAPLAALRFGDPTAELAGRRGDRDEWEDDDGVPDPEILEAAGIRCGLLGTVKQVVGGVEEEVERTTPEAIDLQATFRRMLEAGDRACAMEVSSHALALHRADAIHFEVAIFTNLTQDHLDFHADMEDYFQAKRMLFEAGRGPRSSTSTIPTGAAWPRSSSASPSRPKAPKPTSSPRRFPSMRRGCHEFGVIGPRGNRPIGGEVRTRLPGHFNVANALGAFAAAEALGGGAGDRGGRAGRAERVPGRFEPIDEGQAFAVLVDYAHTPDSLENVLRAARRLTEGG